MAIGYTWRPWRQSHIGRAYEFFHDEVNSFTWAAPQVTR